MYQNPKRAKKLYKEIVAKAVDEYLEFIDKAKSQNELQLLIIRVASITVLYLKKNIMSFQCS